MQIGSPRQDESAGGRCPGANLGQCPHHAEYRQATVIRVLDDDDSSPASGAFMAEEYHHHIVQVIERRIGQFESQLLQARRKEHLGAVRWPGYPDGVQILVGRAIDRNMQHERIPGRVCTSDHSERLMCPQAAANVVAAVCIGETVECRTCDQRHQVLTPGALPMLSASSEMPHSKV